MKINIQLAGPRCDGSIYSISYESFLMVLKKEMGKHVKNVILKGIKKILKN